MKARIKETDMSVPTRRGPWWYYSRTEEGKDYGIHCRRPARGLEELPPAGEPGEEEQILLDENVLAEGSDYFAVGSAAVSHDHRWLAYSTDHRGQREVRAAVPAPRRRASPARPRVGARDRVRPGLVRRQPTTSSTSAWTRPSGPSSSGATSWAATRPATCSSSRSPTGASRSGPARPGTPRSCSSACTAPTPPSGWPSPPPTRWPSPASSCRAARAWSTPSTTSRRPRAAAAGSSS